MSATLRVDASLPYRMSGPGTGATRLLVLAHGVGGNESHLVPLAAQVAADAQVVLVRAPLELGPHQYAWFPVTFGPDGPRPDLDAAEASRRALAGFIGEMQERLDVPASRTVVAGFSQGGIMSASVGLTLPARVAGFAILCGRILPELRPRLAPAHALARVQAFIGHGRADAKLPVQWAHRADAWLSELGVAHETRLYPAAHEVTPAMADDFLLWLDRVVPPVAGSLQ